VHARLNGQSTRIVGTVMIVVGALIMLIDNPAAHTLGAVVPIVGVGLRIEAAILDLRAVSAEDTLKTRP
jgi:hypothetical protein